LAKLTGNLVVAQSGGPTAVINSSLVGVIQEALNHNEITGIYGAIHGIEGILYENLVDLKKEDPQTIEKLKRTPSSALGSCRHKLTPEEYERIVDVFKAHNIRYFLYIGGNDSMETAHIVGKMTSEMGYELTAITEVTVSKGKLLEMEKKIAKLTNICAVYDITGLTDAIIVAKFHSRKELSSFTKALLGMPFVERTNTHIVLTTVKEDFRLI